MSEDPHIETQQAYAQAQAYGKDLARLYALEKERHKKLEITSQKLQAIFDTVPTGLAVIDHDLILLEANPRFLALFELKADCLGQPLSRFLPIEPILKNMKSIANGFGKLGGVELQITQPITRTLLIDLSPLNGGQDWVLVFHDLTERQRLEGLKGEFVNIAAHELRTPLAGVMGFVSVLKEDLKDSENHIALEIMDLILQSTERLKNIIDELVDFAATHRLTEDSLHVNDIDLGRLLHKCLIILQPQIKAKDISYHFDLPSNEIIVQGDPRILTEIIYHLMENSVKFNKPEGKIFIRVQTIPSNISLPAGELARNGIIIEIEDTGIGIPQTELDKIFDKFYQVEEHLVRAVGGLGLGLNIAQRGVERHGGKLWVTSQLGQGSTFRVMLPAITESSDVSIDNRLDVVHQQMLLYAQDMARAVISERKLNKKMERINGLSLTLTEELNQVAVTQAGTEAYLNVIKQTQRLIEEITKLSR
jgi:two-component system phosphate regulon sensor histidine kinase PhoR